MIAVLAALVVSFLAPLSFAPSCYVPPVPALIAVAYSQPACTFCPGHRGVEYDVAANTPVRAVSAGAVTFSGVVAGTRYLVVQQPDGMRATYGMLAAATAGNGDRIMAGQVVGLSTVRLYFGLRDASNAPIDPTSMLGTFVGRRRLVPSDGNGARTGPTPRLVCRAGVSRQLTV